MNFVFALIIAAFSATAFAQVPYPTFSAQEVAVHRANIERLTVISAQCLDAYYNDHIRFFDKYGFSRYYGNRNPAYATRQGRERALAQLGKPIALEREMRPIACIDLALICLRQGFEQTGQAAVWQRIHEYLKIDNKVFGTDLQKMLGDLGWTIAYWNPDPASNNPWDAEDRTLTPLQPGRVWMPVWGGHQARYNEVMNRGTYYKIPVSDARSFVGFKDQPPRGFDQVPFFVGTAHSGYHVFPGYYGRVIEAHSMRSIASRDNFETSLFNPLGTGGGPRWTRTERYRSGLMAIPPKPQ